METPIRDSMGPRLAEKLAGHDMNRSHGFLLRLEMYDIYIINICTSHKYIYIYMHKQNVYVYIPVYIYIYTDLQENGRIS